MPEAFSPPESTAAGLRPLCVDLDGTLVKSDTLVDSLFVLARTRPFRLFALPAQLLRGKAAFKAYVSQQVTLDVAHLPYNGKLLQFLIEERDRGRTLYLATGADERLAQRVADHLGIFQGVLASDGATNLTGNHKLDGLRRHLGAEEFDYVGNDAPDLPLLAHAAEPLLANPSARLCRKLRARGIHPARSFDERGHWLGSFVKAVRPRQWTKNLLIFLPLLPAGRLTLDRLLIALPAFCCFCLAASAAYILNDLLHLEADRRDPQKRLRPFAAGDLQAATGLIAAALFLLPALAGALWLPIGFLGWLLVYLVSALVYATLLKRFALASVPVLAVLYMERLFAGAAATGSHLGSRLAGLSACVFLLLATIRRFAEF